MPEPEALAAALLTLSEQAGKLTALDAREAAHAAEAVQRIAALTELSSALKGSLEDQAEILAGLTALAGQAGDPAGSSSQTGTNGDDEPPAYQPGPPPRFWQLDGQTREQAVGRLRAWVDQVYRPGYGQLAASLGGCWEQHPLCLYTLDWLSELWSVLYLQPCRTPGTLAGQAEWQTRLLAAAAEQMARETARCEHTRTARPAWAGARP